MVSPNITPKKSASAAGAEVKVKVLPVTVYADTGSCKIPPTEINNVVSVGGVTATLQTVRLNVPVLLPLKVPEMSSNFL